MELDRSLGKGYNYRYLYHKKHSIILSIKYNHSSHFCLVSPGCIFLHQKKKIMNIFPGQEWKLYTIIFNDWLIFYSLYKCDTLSRHVTFRDTEISSSVQIPKTVQWWTIGVFISDYLFRKKKKPRRAIGNSRFATLKYFNIH